MRLLARVVDLFVILFATWTLSYELILFIRAPAFATWGVWPTLLAGTWAFFRRKPGRRLKWQECIRQCSPEFTIGLLLAVWKLFVFVPDEDVFSFADRAFWQMGHLREPFAMHYTGLSAKGLPPLSEDHLLTSIEMFATLVARAAHLAPLFVYLVALPSIAAFLAVCVVGLFGRMLRIRKQALWLLLIGFVVAFLLSENVPRSVAMFGLGRLCEGKGALIFLGVPLAYSYVVRFTKSPSIGNWALLAMVGVCFVGWSSTGILVFPLLMLLFASARFLSGRQRRGALAVFAASLFPVICYVVARFGPMPKVHDLSVWLVGWPPDWFTNVSLIANGPTNLVLQLVLFSVGVLLACRRSDRWLAFVPILAILLLFNSATGPLAMRIVPAGVFWRLGYCSAFPLGLGLCSAAAGARSIQQRVAGLCAFVGVVALGFPLALPGQPNVLSEPPLEVHWWRSEYLAARAVRPLLDSPRLLGPERFACILALMDPLLKLDSVRPYETRHLWRNTSFSGSDGESRALAEEYLMGQRKDPGPLIQRIKAGLVQIVVPSQRAAEVETVIRRSHYSLQSRPLSSDFVFLRVGESGH